MGADTREFVVLTRVVTAARLTSQERFLSLKNNEDNGSFNMTMIKATATDIMKVKPRDVEHISFLYSSSSLSKNMRYIASYMPSIAKALPNETSVFCISLIP